jgi:hypothetical protein
LHRIKVKKVEKNLGSIFYGGKTSFFRAKNFNVSTSKKPTKIFSYIISALASKKWLHQTKHRQSITLIMGYLK